MSSAGCIPLFLFGALLGALVASVYREPGFYVPSLIVATTTLVVGWWVQTGLKSREQLHKIPIDYLSNLIGRIDDLTVRCTEHPGGENPNERLVTLGSLGNEIHLLCRILHDVDGESAAPSESLMSHYVDFKAHLTGDTQPDQVLAFRAGRELRRGALEIQWRICRRILDGAAVTGAFR